ncbi:MAG: hypothetical protein PQJ61_02515 [Spirochaetales bacterium]|uniref:Uncharacterized protein n=1 Tax=Candidatus Thalassospirochaeta sargassi TaxID=3119039 RepID=A0AAJ1MMP2_9SPIO|nr:hypothetical protein [Spirochaetales bacterium]
MTFTRLNRTTAGFRLFIAAGVLLLYALLPLSALDDIETTTEISWLTGDMTISASAAVPASAINITTERFRITEAIDRNLTEIVTGAFSSIYLDSLHTLKEGFNMDSRMMAEFDNLNLGKNRTSSSISLDLDEVTNIYKYNIYSELIPILTKHRRTSPPPVLLNYEPTAVFSGIIIYAADPLPYYGESGSGMLNPAVFPKIFDENMELVASAGMASPEYLAEWGFILYTDSYDEKQFEERIGLYPFRTTAEGIFGNNRTDILITEEAARKILYNSKNRRLIEEGRIMVITGAELQ